MKKKNWRRHHLRPLYLFLFPCVVKNKNLRGEELLFPFGFVVVLLLGIQTYSAVDAATGLLPTASQLLGVVALVYPVVAVLEFSR